MQRRLSPRVPTLTILCCLAACRAPVPDAVRDAGGGAGSPVELGGLVHVGPEVSLARSGPARFARTLLETFDRERAFETTAALDRLYRTPGSDDYDTAIDLVAAGLREVGYGSEAGLELYEIETPLPHGGWSAREARLTLVLPDGTREILHEFDDTADRDRFLFPAGALDADLMGTAAFGLDEIRPGNVLVTDARVRMDVANRARRKGAVAIVTSSLQSVNVDPSGADRHLDAILFRSVEPDMPITIAHISPRSMERIAAAHREHGAVKLAFHARADRRPAVQRTLVAELIGRERPEETVAVLVHIQAPGASDNASGSAGALELARDLARLVREGRLERPARTISFVWGGELSGSAAWFERTERQVVAGVCLDMIGPKRAETGGIPLLERSPDPGAELVIPPDEHTAWGARDIEPEWVVPDGLAIIARCALADVALETGGWDTAEHPFEGGTDHETLVRAGVPAVLFWHFPDFTFHTSLDRIDMIDPAELERMAVAGMATALAVADPKAGDLERYLQSLVLDRRLRVEAALADEEPEVAARWKAWFEGARAWLRAQCLGLEPPEPVPLPPVNDE